MAELEWKGAVWRAAYGDLSVKELLTILKGFGPMEILEFEKAESFRGQISLSLAEQGVKQLTLYHLEVLGPKRKGTGREAIQWLKKIFKGDVHVEDPGVIFVRNANQESLLFWCTMFREGLIQSLESEHCSLHPGMSEAEVDKTERGIVSQSADHRIAASDGKR